MFAGFGTAIDTNRRFHELLAAGGDGLSTAFDLPTLMGRDSDDELALGEVGKCGVAVDTLADMHDLYRGIDLGAVTTSMTINGPAAVIFAMFVANAEANGVDRARLGGTLQNDILKEYQAQKEFIFPPRPSLRLVARHDRVLHRGDAALASDLDLRVPHPRSRIDRGAGARVHRRATDSRTSSSRCEPGSPSTRSRRASRSSSTRTSTSSRRSRSTAPRAGSGRAGCASGTARSSSGRCRCASTRRPPGVSLTAQQPEVNIVRTAIEALAGVLGGTQSLHTNSMDETLALPSEKAARIALRTQQVIAHETRVTNVADPLGGSWYVEALTDEMERRAEADLRPDRGAR